MTKQSCHEVQCRSNIGRTVSSFRIDWAALENGMSILFVAAIWCLMRQIYQYVGPRNIADRISSELRGFQIDSSEDVLRWVRQTDQESSSSRSITATFVIDEANHLLIADRRSEHLACAGGKPVLSAGEMTFTLKPSGVSVSYVTNQSTGYCPEPESWEAVRTALVRAGFVPPDRFSQAFLFRRCPRCRSINIIKDGGQPNGEHAVAPCVAARLNESVCRSAAPTVPDDAPCSEQAAMTVHSQQLFWGIVKRWKRGGHGAA